MSLVDRFLAYGMALFFGFIIASVFLQDVFGALGFGKTLLFTVSVGLLAYTGVIW